MVDYRDCQIDALVIISDLFKKYKYLNVSLTPNDVNYLSNELIIKLALGESIEKANIFARDYLIYKSILMYKDNVNQELNVALYYILEFIIVGVLSKLQLQKEAFDIEKMIVDIINTYNFDTHLDTVISDFASNYEYRRSNKFN